MKRGGRMRGGAASSVRPGAASAAALLLLLASGCGGGGEGDGRSGSVTDSAGVSVVSNGAGGVWGAAGGCTVSGELRTGRMEGDPDYQLGRVSALGVTSDGRIWVMDQQTRPLKVYGPDGAHLRDVGSAGSGPGEFGPGAGPVLVTRGDTLRVPALAFREDRIYGVWRDELDVQHILVLAIRRDGPGAEARRGEARGRRALARSGGGR